MNTSTTPTANNGNTTGIFSTTKGKWALALVILISFLLIGMPFLGPFFFFAIPIFFILSIPALIWFLHMNKKDKE